MQARTLSAVGTTIALATGAVSVLMLLSTDASAQPKPPGEGAPAEPPPAEPPPPKPPTGTQPATPSPSPPPAAPAAAAAEAPSLVPKLSGHVAATYNYNFMDPVGRVTPFHSYTAPHNSFLLNQAHLALTGSDDHVAYAVEIDGGTDAVLDTAPLGSYFDIQEAWVSYTFANGFGVKAGKFVTYNGIEVIEAPANPTISRGFLFGLVEPFTHVGALATYKMSDQLDFALGVINGWDRIVDNNDNKTIVAKAGVTQEKMVLTISALAGKESNSTDYRATLDATAVVKLPKLDLWLQGNVGFEQHAGGMAQDAVWYGFGVQPVYKIDDKLSIGARIEALFDPDAARTLVAQNLFNVSVAPAYKLHDKVTVRAEGRLDFSTEDVFQSKDVTQAPGAIQLIALAEMSVVF